MSTGQDAKFRELKQLAQQMPGQRLPGERELAARLDISRPRLRSILATLASEGLVRRRHGSGTYVIGAQETGALRRVALWIDSGLKLAADPFFSHVVECLQSELQEAGCECLMRKTDGSSLPRYGEDGIITLGTTGRYVIETWAAPQPPLVSLFITDEVRPGVRASILQIADRRAGRLAARRLVEQGALQVIFFGRRAVPVVQERLAGVEVELAQSHVPLTIIECALNYAAGVEAGRAVKMPQEEKIGLIAANDWLAVGLHAGLSSQRGVNPHRLKIVSFDGLPMTNDPVLGIESLAVPIEVMARDAVAELRRLRKSGALGRSIEYPLAWRETASAL